MTTVHALEPHLLDDSRARRARYLREQCRRAADRTELFFPVSSYIGDWLLDLGIPNEKVQTVYLGIDTEFWKPISSAITGEIPKIVFVGNLTTLKGILDLIRISVSLMSEVPHQLEIIGDGPLRRDVDELASHHQQLSVRGRLPREGVRHALASASCLVLPTQRHQGIMDAAPFVLMEAQSMAVPAICFDVGGTAELMACSALLAPERDFDTLGQIIRNQLTLSPLDRAELGTRVRSWTVTHRSRRAGAAATLQAYESLTGLATTTTP